MADIRIHVPKERKDIIERLKIGENSPWGVFKTYADLMVFAAMLGYRYKKKLPFEGSLIDPIRFEVFETAGHSKVFYLLALIDSDRPEILANNEEAEKERFKLFEAYANGGLEYLEKQLYGKDDCIDHLLLIIGMDRPIGAAL